LVPELHPASVGKDQRAQVLGRPLHDLGLHLEPAGAEGVVLDEGDRDGPQEVVPLVAGMLAGGVGQLARQDVRVGREPRQVVRGERDDDVVGHDPAAPDADHASGVEGAGDLAADLDGLETGAEGLREGPLHQPLEPPLEPLESHRAEV
jgi:hypothetical protein